MKKKYILSLDGGGVRTIATITFLQKLENHLGVPLADKFDFFIGTSAGAISSLGLAVNKMSSVDLMEIWSEENLNRTMTNSSWETHLGIMQINPKYTNEGKREVLEEFFGEKKIGDAVKPVAVTSYDIEKRIPVLLSSYGDPNISVVDAGDATSAAPVYYPTAEVGGRYLIDGGIVANHPVLHGYVEAKKIYPNTEFVVLSVGTGLNKRPLKGKDSMKEPRPAMISARPSLRLSRVANCWNTRIGSSDDRTETALDRRIFFVRVAAAASATAGDETA